MVAETRLIAAAYALAEDAQAAVKDLRELGLPEEQITVVYTDSGHLIQAGIVGGAVWGGALGALVGVLFPPAGLLVVAGPILGVLTSSVGLGALGAITVGALDGVISALVSLGLPRDLATHMGEHLQKGDALVVAHVTDPDVFGEAQLRMERHHPRAVGAPSSEAAVGSR